MGTIQPCCKHQAKYDHDLKSQLVSFTVLAGIMSSDLDSISYGDHLTLFQQPCHLVSTFKAQYDLDLTSKVVSRNVKTLQIQTSNFFNFKFLQLQISSTSNFFNYKFLQLQISTNLNFLNFKFLQLQFLQLQISSISNFFNFKFLQLQFSLTSIFFNFKFLPLQISSTSNFLYFKFL